MPLPAGYLTPVTYGVVDSWANSVVGDLNAYVAAEAGAATATTVTYVSTKSGLVGTAFDGVIATGEPDFARNVVCTITHASAVVALSGVITGIDLRNKQVTEAWSVTAGTTSKTYTGVKAFKSVLSITVVSAADASGNTIDIGTGEVFGLSKLCTSIVLQGELEDGVAPTAGTLVAGVEGGSATADVLGTYAPNSTPNGALDFDIWYLSNKPFFHLSRT